MLTSRADVDTRRRGACDLVRALCVFSEQEITHLFGAFVQSLLQVHAGLGGSSVSACVYFGRDIMLCLSAFLTDL